jgi:hypothetical protein
VVPLALLGYGLYLALGLSGPRVSGPAAFTPDDAVWVLGRAPAFSRFVLLCPITERACGTWAIALDQARTSSTWLCRVGHLEHIERTPGPWELPINYLRP